MHALHWTGLTLSQNDIATPYLPKVTHSAPPKGGEGFCEFPHAVLKRLPSFAGLLALNDPPGQLPRVKCSQMVPKASWSTSVALVQVLPEPRVCRRALRVSPMSFLPDPQHPLPRRLGGAKRLTRMASLELPAQPWGSSSHSRLPYATRMAAPGDEGASPGCTRGRAGGATQSTHSNPTPRIRVSCAGRAYHAPGTVLRAWPALTTLPSDVPVGKSEASGKETAEQSQPVLGHGDVEIVTEVWRVS